MIKVDNIEGLRVLRHRINEKKPFDMQHIALLDDAIAEFAKLRYSLAISEFELHDRLMELNALKKHLPNSEDLCKDT